MKGKKEIKKKPEMYYIVKKCFRMELLFKINLISFPFLNKWQEETILHEILIINAKCVDNN